MKRTVLVKSDHLAQMAGVLTGYGEIKGIDHEGTITYELEGDDAFELGRQAEEVRQELRAYDTSVDFVTAKGEPALLQRLAH